MRAKSLQPTIQLVIVGSVMATVLATQQLFTQSITLLSQNTKTQYIQSADSLVRVAAEAVPNCTGPTGPIQLGETERDKSLGQYRMTWSGAGSEPWEYDSLNPYYFSQTSTKNDERFGNFASTIAIVPSDANQDSRVTGMLGQIVGYRPTQLKDAFVLKYQSTVNRGNDTEHKGSSPGIVVPSKAGWPVCAPKTSYDIGPSYMEAMVMLATSDRVTLHIGRNEYMASSNACGDRSRCSGGYWIYISGINVDSAILSAYQSVSAIQQSAGRDISQNIMLPMVEEGRKLGTSMGDSFRIVVRDDGPLIKLNQDFLWSGVGERSFVEPTPTQSVNVNPTSTSNRNATATPRAPTPTNYIFFTPTPTPNHKFTTPIPTIRLSPTTTPRRSSTPTRIPTSTPRGDGKPIAIQIPPTSTPTKPNATPTSDAKISVGEFNGDLYIRKLRLTVPTSKDCATNRHDGRLYCHLARAFKITRTTEEVSFYLATMNTNNHVTSSVPLGLDNYEQNADSTLFIFNVGGIKGLLLEDDTEKVLFHVLFGNYNTEDIMQNNIDKKTYQFTPDIYK